jgi:hypothetical protein
MVNDKIYELAKQADLIEFDSIPGSNAVTPSYESLVKARKFAELIVRECIRVPYDMWDKAELNADVAVKIDHRIKEHFGVEE